MKLLKTLMQIRNLFIFIVFLLLVMVGCASWFMNGGALVDEDYYPNVIVNYDAEGTVPAGVNYLLVRTENGEAVFERSLDGSGVLFQTHWEDNDGDHFAGWVSKSHGYEFVVPKDRTQPAKKYIYPAGYYSLLEKDGITRPVPVVEIDPVATLIPQ